MDIEEQNIKEKYNLQFYNDSNNLNQNNKYKFYISNDNHKGKIKYR